MKETIFSFMRYLFYKINFAPSNIDTYKPTLAKPFLWAFGLNASQQAFADYYKT